MVLNLGPEYRFEQSKRKENKRSIVHLAISSQFKGNKVAVTEKFLHINISILIKIRKKLF